MSEKTKVIEVVDRGGQGGAASQVAAVRSGLDPARFEAGMVDVSEISPAKNWAAFKKLLKIFREERPGVVHAHGFKAGLLARPAAKIAGVPKIFYSPRGYEFLRQDLSAAAKILRFVAEWSVSWIGTLVAESPSEAALARPLSWGKPVRLAPRACLMEPPQAPLPQKEGLIFFGACGRVTAARDPDAFAHLCQRLTDARYPIRCVWIGAGAEEEARLRWDLENMNLLRKVELTGWLDPRETAKRLAGLDVLVHGTKHNALPGAVLEAMALGLPVVASDLPACRDAVVPGETGFLAKDDIELLECCLKLADDPALRRKMGEAGRARAQKEFSLGSLIQKIETLYSA